MARDESWLRSVAHAHTLRLAAWQILVGDTHALDRHVRASPDTGVSFVEALQREGFLSFVA